MVSQAKPLTATIAERLGLPDKLVAEVQRPSPPAARPPAEKPVLHALPPPKGPERGLVDVSKEKPGKKVVKRARRWHKIPEKEAFALVCRYREMLADGMKKKDAAKKLDITPSLMERHCKKPFRMPDELRTKLLARADALIEKGASQALAAKAIAVHQTTLSLWRREAGHPARPPRPRKSAPNGAAPAAATEKAPKPTGERPWRAAAPMAAKGPRSVEAIVAEMTEVQARMSALKRELHQRALLGE